LEILSGVTKGLVLSGIEDITRINLKHETLIQSKHTTQLAERLHYT